MIYAYSPQAQKLSRGSINHPRLQPSLNNFYTLILNSKLENFHNLTSKDVSLLNSLMHNITIKVKQYNKILAQLFAQLN